jgi:small conductance mechanosensitive channel
MVTYRNARTTRAHRGTKGVDMDGVDFSWVAEARDLIVHYTPSVLGGIAILIVGWMASKIVARSLRAALGRFERVDATLRNFFVSLVRYIILIFTVLAVLSAFGVQTASLIAIFGAAGLAVGLALQGTLSNVAAGVMLLLFRPFRVGDYIDGGGGAAGTVKDLSLFVTELATPDNVQVIVPNSLLWGAVLKNYSFHPTRRVDFLLGISYDDSIDTAFEAIHEVIGADQRIHAEPAPQVVVGELADSSVNVIVRVWCNAPDYWGLKFDLTKRFKENLEAKGITIPYPQQDVYMHHVKPEAA